MWGFSQYGKKILNKSKIFIPINLNNHHWVGCVVDLTEEVTRYYDSYNELNYDELASQVGDDQPASEVVDVEEIKEDE